jgi:hypothetical protein
VLACRILVGRPVFGCGFTQESWVNPRKVVVHPCFLVLVGEKRYQPPQISVIVPPTLGALCCCFFKGFIFSFVDSRVLVVWALSGSCPKIVEASVFSL